MKWPCVFASLVGCCYFQSNEMPSRRTGWIDWKNSAAREILMEDLEPHGWLYENNDDAVVIYEVYKHLQSEFADVSFDQFEARLKAARQQCAIRRARSREELMALEHDRRLHPRNTHNERGERVFDMDPAKLLLREDVNNKVHERMKPQELWASRPEYMNFKLKLFRPRIYQEIRRVKYFNFLEDKRTKLRKNFKEKSR